MAPGEKSMTHPGVLLGLTLLVALPAALLTACERTIASGPEVVVAKVNGVAIAAREGSSRQELEAIIDRELLVQKALEAGLDRDPLVLQSIDNARRQLLADAYLRQAASGVARSKPEEIHRFYAENPALFSERRIYHLRTLAVSAPAEMLDVLRAEAERAVELEELAAWLRRRGARVATTSVTLPAEQVALSRLPKLARMEQGRIAVFPSAHGASVVQLVRAEPAPLSEQQATPLIDQFLAGRRRMEFAAVQLRTLRGRASIEYSGGIKR